MILRTSNINSLATLPFQIGERCPGRISLRHIRGDGFVDTRSDSLVELIRDLHLGLREAGLAAGDCVAVIAESRPEWCIADFAVLTTAGVTVPAYPTLTSSQIAHILRGSGATIAVCRIARRSTTLPAFARTSAR